MAARATRVLLALLASAGLVAPATGGTALASSSACARARGGGGRGGDESVHIYEASAADVPAIYEMLSELAAFEGLKGSPLLTAEQLKDDLAAGHFWCVLAAPAPGSPPCAYALGYSTFCTWEGKGLYLEDLYVRPHARSRGVGRALIQAVARRALDRGCAAAVAVAGVERARVRILHAARWRERVPDGWQAVAEPDTAHRADAAANRSGQRRGVSVAVQSRAGRTTATRLTARLAELEFMAMTWHMRASAASAFRSDLPATLSAREFELRHV
jgi:GNAT superfamily N-acetyltransferase